MLVPNYNKTNIFCDEPTCDNLVIDLEYDILNSRSKLPKNWTLTFHIGREYHWCPSCTEKSTNLMFVNKEDLNYRTSMNEINI